MHMHTENVQNKTKSKYFNGTNKLNDWSLEYWDKNAFTNYSTLTAALNPYESFHDNKRKPLKITSLD